MSRSLYTWIKTFLVIITVMTLLLILLVNWMLRSFQRDSKELNYNLTSVIQRSVDIRLKDISDFMSQLELNNTNIKISNSNSLNTVESSEIYWLKKQLTDFKVSNTFIESIFMYYPKLDYVIGDMGGFRSPHYYLMLHNLENRGYENWVDFIESEEVDKSLFFENAVGEKELLFLKQLKEEGKPKSVLVLKIREEEVLKLLNNETFTPSDSLTAMVDDENRIYTFSGDEKIAKLLSGLSPDDYTKHTVELGEYWGVIRNSDFRGIKYVTLMNLNEVLGSVYFIRRIAYLTLVLLMIMGAVLFIVWGRRNNRPLVNLVGKFHDSVPDGNAQIKDEYGFINSRIDYMLADNLKHLEKLEMQSGIIESLFLNNLLVMEERNNAVIFAHMQKCNLQFEYPLFQVGLFRKAENENVLLHVMEEIKGLHQDIYAISTMLQKDMVILFNMEEEYNGERMRSIMSAILEKTAYRTTFYMGGIYDSMAHIISSYQDAVAISDSGKNTDCVVAVYNREEVCENIQVKKNSGIMTEYELYMLDGNYEEAKKCVDMLWNRYIPEDRFPFTARCKKYAVLNSLIEAMKRIDGENDSFDADKYCRRLSALRDREEFSREMHLIFDRLIALTGQVREKKREDAALKAKEYIDAKYEDSMLGLYSISEYLGVTNTYLSSVFKKKYNIGVIQYINSLRIDKAKKLILNSEYSMKEIAQKVGFSSDVTFIRVFKQYEHVTPGKFRQK